MRRHDPNQQSDIAAGKPRRRFSLAANGLEVALSGYLIGAVLFFGLGFWTGWIPNGGVLVLSTLLTEPSDCPSAALSEVTSCRGEVARVMFGREESVRIAAGRPVESICWLFLDARGAGGTGSDCRFDRPAEWRQAACGPALGLAQAECFLCSEPGTFLERHHAVWFATDCFSARHFVGVGITPRQHALGDRPGQRR